MSQAIPSLSAALKQSSIWRRSNVRFASFEKNSVRGEAETIVDFSEIERSAENKSTITRTKKIAATLLSKSKAHRNS